MCKGREELSLGFYLLLVRNCIISSIVFVPSLGELYFGRGGPELSAYFIGGLLKCVQEGGGRKRPKNCVHTISMAPYITRV